MGYTKKNKQNAEQKKLNLESAEAQMQVADGATSHSSFCLANAATARRFNQFLEFIRKAANLTSPFYPK